MKTYVVGVCAIALALGVSFLPAPGFAAEPVFKLKYASFMPSMHKVSLLSDEWCKEVQKRTNGRVKVSYFSSGTLVSANQMYDGVVKGVIDIGFSVISYTPGRFPLTEGLYQPLGVKTAYQATKMANAFYQKYKPKEFDDVKLFYLHQNGPGYIHTKKPVKKLADLKGLRIKSDAQTALIVTALGATPTTMPMLETYDALKRGLADGVILGSETLQGFKFGDVCKNTYINYGATYSATFWIAMNKEKWDSLPKDIQQIIDKLNEEWVERQGRLWDQLDEEFFTLAKKTDHQVFYATPEEQAIAAQKVRSIFDTYVKNTKEKGLPGEEAMIWAMEYLKTAPLK